MHLNDRDTYETNNHIFQQNIAAAKSINIAFYLHDRYNYPIKKDGRELIVLTNSPAGKIHVFADRNNRNTWLYKSWGTGEAGNIFQYLSKNENAGDLSKAATVNTILSALRHYCPSVTVTNQYHEHNKRLINAKPDLHFLPHTSRNYLHSRGIDDAIVLHPKYSNCIYNKLFFPNPDKPFSFLNTAFPVKNMEGAIVDFSMKNSRYNRDGHPQTFSSYVADGNKSNGLWTSNTDKDVVGKITSFVIAESEIDALSYTKLHPACFNHTLDISFGGHIALPQLEMISQLVKKYEPLTIKLIVDNDQNGHKYAQDIIDQLSIFPGIGIYKDLAPSPHKDWNEVLMAKEGLKTAAVQQNMNRYQGQLMVQVKNNPPKENIEKKIAVTGADKEVYQ
jgi:Toprim-like